MYYVITELQDVCGFAIVDEANMIKGNYQERIVFSGTEKECNDFYVDRHTEWNESLESQLCY